MKILTLLTTDHEIEVELAALTFFVSERFYFIKKSVQSILNTHINAMKKTLTTISFKLRK